MDGRERARKQAHLDQGLAFTRLSSHADWPMFRIWMERARADYDRLLHDPAERHNLSGLARWAEGYDALNNLLTAMDRTMASVGALTKELEDDESGRTTNHHTPITGRRVS